MVYEEVFENRKPFEKRKKKYRKASPKRATASGCASVLFMITVVIGMIVVVSAMLSACGKESSSYYKLEQPYSHMTATEAKD
jgi:hypothetical protein